MARARAPRATPASPSARPSSPAPRESDERAWITTIHGFCRRLLAAHPVAAGIDPRFRVLDEAEAGAARASGRSTAALEELIGARRRRRSAARRAPRYRPAAARATMIAGRARRGCAARGWRPARLPGSPERRCARSRPARTSPSRSRPAEAEAAARRPQPRSSALLEGFHRRYERLKAERSGARLRGPRAARARAAATRRRVSAAWRERFAHLLVDEFQDTNRVQLGADRALRGPETRLFCVGDEFQSIYRFRHADLEVFRERRERGAKPTTAPRCWPLRGNFRSAPGAARGGRTSPARRCSTDFAPLAWGRPERPSGRAPPARSSCCSPARRARQDAASWKSRRDRARSAALGGQPADASPRRASWRGACASWSTRRGRARRHGRPAARLHPRRRLRGGARARRPGPLRGRRPRLLVPAAGRGPRAPAGRGREPARRRARCFGALASPGRAREPRRALAAAPGRRRAAATSGRWSPGATAGAEREPHEPELEWLDARPGRGRRSASARFCDDPRPAARRGAAAGARGAGRAVDDRLRLRPGAARPAGRARADGERAQADAPGARVRAPRGPRPRRFLLAAAEERAAATSARAWRRSGPRGTTGSG